MFDPSLRWFPWGEVRLPKTFSGWPNGMCQTVKTWNECGMVIHEIMAIQTQWQDTVNSCKSLLFMDWWPSPNFWSWHISPTIANHQPTRVNWTLLIWNGSAPMIFHEKNWVITSNMSQLNGFVWTLAIPQIFLLIIIFPTMNDEKHGSFFPMSRQTQIAGSMFIGLVFSCPYTFLVVHKEIYIYISYWCRTVTHIEIVGELSPWYPFHHNFHNQSYEIP